MAAYRTATRTSRAQLAFPPLAMAMCGGPSDAKPADAEMQALFDGIRADAEKELGACAEFTLHSYITQVVAGTNIVGKVHVGEGKYAHIKVFRALPHTGEAPKVTSTQKDKTEACALAL